MAVAKKDTKDTKKTTIKKTTKTTTKSTNKKKAVKRTVVNDTILIEKPIKREFAVIIKLLKNSLKKSKSKKKLTMEKIYSILDRNNIRIDDESSSSLFQELFDEGLIDDNEMLLDDSDVAEELAELKKEAKKAAKKELDVNEEVEELSDGEMANTIVDTKDHVK
jgi:hypothetical protein